MTRDKTSARRHFMSGAAAVALAAPAGVAQATNGRGRQHLRLTAEGDADLSWVLSLYTPPTLPPSLPPGLVIKAKFDYPSSAGHHRGRDVMSLFIYLSAVVPPGVPPPVLQPISGLDVAVEHIFLSRADHGAEDRPEKNLTMSGRIIANDVESPFGPLAGRGFTMCCGFAWDNGHGGAATFKLVAGSAAGSHTTVLREARGSLDLRGRWPF